MLIAVIADTHNKLPPHVIEDLRRADEIWHLGDVMRPATLDALHALDIPLLVVRGNNDDHLEWPLVLNLTRGGQSIRLIHIPPRRIGGCEILIHGHTHKPRDEMVEGVRVLNPGTVGMPNKGAPPSYAWLEITDTDPPEFCWQVVPV